MNIYKNEVEMGVGLVVSLIIQNCISRNRLFFEKGVEIYENT